MAANPPYMTSYGRLPGILNKIRRAKTPDRFTNDFLRTKLGFKSSNDRPFIGLAKRLGLLGQDGAPTELYKSFRNTDPRVSRAAMASAIRQGYEDLYALNEYAHDLDSEDLQGLVIQLTGLAADSRIVQNIVKSFEALKEHADFEAAPEAEEEEAASDEEPLEEEPSADRRDLGVGLMYSINLLLPKTDDVAVFNAIFRSLRDNLLRK